MNVTDLRKAFSAQGIKGFSSANRAAFNAAIEAAEIEAYTEDAARAPKPVVAVTVAPKSKNLCIVCGERRGMSAAKRNEMGIGRDFGNQCFPCYEEAGWENAHSDSNHAAILEVPDALRTQEDLSEINGCWICFPELNQAKRPARSGRSRAGMVIVAKGTELHKSETFRLAAEAAGWSVNVLGYVNLAEDGEEQERYVATATKGGDTIELAWNGRAYDYASSSMTKARKARKVRNLKEALRLI
jgi:hypothetical protein